MILVSGATGNVGGELVRLLAADGHAVRGLVRDSEGDTLPDGAESATGDLDVPESLRPALADVEAVFFLPGYRDMPGLAAEARRAGVQHAVQLSGPSAAVGGLHGCDHPIHGRVRGRHPWQRPAMDDSPAERVHVQHVPMAGPTGAR